MTRAMGTVAEKVREFIAHYDVGEQFTLNDIRNGIDVKFKPRVDNPNTVELGCVTGPLAQLIKQGVISKADFILKGKRKIRTYRVMTSDFNVYTNRPTTQGGTPGRTWDKHIEEAQKAKQSGELLYPYDPPKFNPPREIIPQAFKELPVTPPWVQQKLREGTKQSLSLQAQLADIVEKLKDIINILEQPAENFLHEISTEQLFNELKRRTK